MPLLAMILFAVVFTAVVVLLRGIGAFINAVIEDSATEGETE